LSSLLYSSYTLFNSGDAVYDSSTGTYPISRNYLLILDAEGNVRWYLSGPGAGDIDATYLGQEQILFAGQNNVTTFFAPTIVGLNKQTVYSGDTIPVVTSPVPNVVEQPGSYTHDVGFAQDGHSIYTLSYTHNLNFLNPLTGKYQQGFVLKQVDPATNTILWYWDSYAAVANPQLAASNPLAQSVPAYVDDPWHPNAVWDTVETVNGTPTPRHFVYVSLRNLSTVFKIDRDNPGAVTPNPRIANLRSSGAWARSPLSRSPAQTRRSSSRSSSCSMRTANQRRCCPGPRSRPRTCGSSISTTSRSRWTAMA